MKLVNKVVTSEADALCGSEYVVMAFEIWALIEVRVPFVRVVKFDCSVESSEAVDIKELV